MWPFYLPMHQYLTGYEVWKYTGNTPIWSNKFFWKRSLVCKLYASFANKVMAISIYCQIKFQGEGLNKCLHVPQSSSIHEKLKCLVPLSLVHYTVNVFPIPLLYTCWTGIKHEKIDFILFQDIFQNQRVFFKGFGYLKLRQMFISKSLMYFKVWQKVISIYLR